MAAKNGHDHDGVDGNNGHVGEYADLRVTDLEALGVELEVDSPRHRGFAGRKGQGIHPALGNNIGHGFVAENVCDGVLLLSESSRGSSSAHQAHVPQARGRRLRQGQAANTPSTYPGRDLPAFHKASEVFYQISWLPSHCRRVRIFLTGRSLDGCADPGADHKCVPSIN